MFDGPAWRIGSDPAPALALIAIRSTARKPLIVLLATAMSSGIDRRHRVGDERDRRRLADEEAALPGEAAGADLAHHRDPHRCGAGAGEDFDLGDAAVAGDAAHPRVAFRAPDASLAPGAVGP